METAAAEVVVVVEIVEDEEVAVANLELDEVEAAAGEV